MKEILIKMIIYLYKKLFLNNKKYLTLFCCIAFFKNIPEKINNYEIIYTNIDLF